MKKITMWKTLAATFIFDRFSRKDFLVGLGITSLTMVGIFIVSLLLGIIEIESVGFDLKNLIFYTGLTFLSAGYEELVFRCILLTILIKIIRNPWLAILITSIYFGYVHFDNVHATLLSAFSNGIGGVMYGVAFIYTRKIWFPWALHFAWNYVQAPLLGFPMSGFEVKGLLNINIVDYTWVSGGLYGPEGGIVGISFRFIVILLIVLWIKKSRGKFDHSIQQQGSIQV